MANVSPVDLGAYDKDSTSYGTVRFAGDVMELLLSQREYSSSDAIHKLDANLYTKGELDSEGNPVLYAYNHAKDKTERVDNLKRTQSVMRARLNAGVVPTSRIRDIWADLGVKCATPSQCLWFTLTFADSELGMNESESAKAVGAFILRFRKWFETGVASGLVLDGDEVHGGKPFHYHSELSQWGTEFRYMWAKEPQGSGRWHYHCVFAFPEATGYIYLPDSVRSELWGLGFTNCKALKSGARVAEYLCAYLANTPVDSNTPADAAVYTGKDGKKYVKGGRLSMYANYGRLYSFSRNWPHAETIRVTGDVAQRISVALEKWEHFQMAFSVDYEGSGVSSALFLKEKLRLSEMSDDFFKFFRATVNYLREAVDIGDADVLAVCRHDNKWQVEAAKTPLGRAMYDLNLGMPELANRPMLDAQISDGHFNGRCDWRDVRAVEILQDAADIALCQRSMTVSDFMDMMLAREAERLDDMASADCGWFDSLCEAVDREHDLRGRAGTLRTGFAPELDSVPVHSDRWFTAQESYEVLYKPFEG